MLNERVHRVLWAVVDSYITNPDPVGSRFVSKKYSFNLSPATIRNIMADLEEMGYLRQPHTSAGRVPTDKGYRFYVDLLVREGILDSSSNNELIRRLQLVRSDIDSLLDETTKALSKLSHYLGIALPPKADESTLRRITLFRYRENHAAALLLTDEGIVKNKIIQTDFDLSQRDLNRINEYLNSEFAGQTISEIRSRLVSDLYKDKALCDSLISRAIDICRETIFFTYSTVFISGLSEMLGLPDFSDLERIKEISRAIEDKHLIIKLLDSLSETEGMKVVIGSENRTSGMQKLSMVVSTYKDGDKLVGMIGVIGPTRMDYMKAITYVDTTARYITKVLNEETERPSRR
jgi:heat-inducible transcriptional repressor